MAVGAVGTDCTGCVGGVAAGVAAAGTGCFAVGCIYSHPLTCSAASSAPSLPSLFSSYRSCVCFSPLGSCTSSCSIDC